MASATLFDFYQQQEQEAAEADFLVNELLYFQDSSSGSSSSCFIDLQPPPPASNSLFDLDDDCCFDINALMEEDILYPLPNTSTPSPIPSSPPQLQNKSILHDTTTTIPPPPPPPPQPQFDNHYNGDYDVLFPEPEPEPAPPEQPQKYYYAIKRISASSIDNQLLLVPPFYPELTDNKRLKLMPSYQEEDYDRHHHPLPDPLPLTNNCCSFDDGIVPCSINTSSAYNGTDPKQFNNYYTLMNPAGILGQVPLYPNYLPTAPLPPNDQQRFAVPLQVPPPQKETSASTNIVSAQSIAARERRRKITEKTQEIAKLVPGGTKMNTAEMLQSAFKYVKFLQAQVGLLQLIRSPPHCSDHQSQQGVGEQMDIEPNLLLLLHSLLMSQSVQEKLYMTEYCLIPADFLNTFLAADRSGGTDAYECTSSSISNQLKELLLRHSSQSQPLIN